MEKIGSMENEKIPENGNPHGFLEMGEPKWFDTKISVFHNGMKKIIITFK